MANKIDGSHMYRTTRTHRDDDIASKRRDFWFRVGRQIGQQNANLCRKLMIRRCYRNIDSFVFKVCHIPNNKYRS